MTGEMIMEKGLVFTLATSAVIFGALIGNSNAVESASAEVSTPSKKEVLFEDHFERNDLGEQYTLVDPDPNRLIVSDGKLLIVATEPKKNKVLLQKSFPDDFVVTAAVTVQLTINNWVALYYQLDDRNNLAVGIAAAPWNRMLPWGDVDYSLSTGSAGRRPFFGKVIEGQRNDIVGPTERLGNRQLKGYASKPETWYLQIQRVGSKYTGSVSVDGTRWTRLGTHVIVQKHGQIGVGAGSGGGVENPAEFDDLVVQGSR